MCSTGHQAYVHVKLQDGTSWCDDTKCRSQPLFVHEDDASVVRNSRMTPALHAISNQFKSQLQKCIECEDFILKVAKHDPDFR